MGGILLHYDGDDTLLYSYHCYVFVFQLDYNIYFTTESFNWTRASIRSHTDDSVGVELGKEGTLKKNILT